MTADPFVFRTPDSAQFVYFDWAPFFGVFSGAIQIELASRILVPAGGQVGAEFVINAHLRCTPDAAISLRNALDKALKMLGEPEASTVAANKLN